MQEYETKRWNLNAPFRSDPSADRLRPETFDLINSRFLAAGLDAPRWASYIRELRTMLKPGGWLQMVELAFPFVSSSGLLTDESALSRWWRWYETAGRQPSRNFRIGRELGPRLTQEGFARVSSQTHILPVGDWDPGACPELSC